MYALKSNVVKPTLEDLSPLLFSSVFEHDSSNETPTQSYPLSTFKTLTIVITMCNNASAVAAVDAAAVENMTSFLQLRFGKRLANRGDMFFREGKLVSMGAHDLAAHCQQLPDSIEQLSDVHTHGNWTWTVPSKQIVEIDQLRNEMQHASNTSRVYDQNMASIQVVRDVHGANLSAMFVLSCMGVILDIDVYSSIHACRYMLFAYNQELHAYADSRVLDLDAFNTQLEQDCI